MIQKVSLKFEEQVYKCELPISDNFTGKMALIFHWKDGKLMNAEILKNNSVTISTELSTDLGIDLFKKL